MLKDNSVFRKLEKKSEEMKTRQVPRFITSKAASIISFGSLSRRNSVSEAIRSERRQMVIEMQKHFSRSF